MVAATSGCPAMRYWAMRSSTFLWPIPKVMPLNQPPELKWQMGIPRSCSSRKAGAVTWALPNTDRVDTSMSLVSAISSLPFLIFSNSPDLPTTAPWVVTYSGRASSRAGTMRRTSSGRTTDCPWLRKDTSSGRQMPTSEHRGHFGLSCSGGGIFPAAAMPRADSSSSVVRLTRASSKGTVTRRLEPMKYSSPSSHSKPPDRRNNPCRQSWTRSGSHTWPGTSGTVPRL